MTESITGSIAVDVVPSAKGFWAKFKAETQAEGRTIGEQLGRQLAQAIGSKGDSAGDEFSRKMRTRMEAALRSLPKAKVDADTSPADRQIAQLRANLARLTDKRVLLNLSDNAALATLRAFEVKLAAVAKDSPSIRMRVDAKAATAELAALRAELGLVPDELKKSESETKLLLKSIITFGPALIPAAAAIAALAAGIGGLGITGVFAFKGIQREMTAQTATGLQYRLGLNQIKGEFGSLSSVAAKATLPGFQQAVVTLHSALPGLNSEVKILGSELGSIGSHTISGLVNGFQTFAPLINHAAQDVDILAARFESWSTGPGGARFADALGHSLDEFGPALAQIAEAVAHVVAAFAPVGGTVLHSTEALAKAINTIPLPVLEAFATTLVAFNSAKLASGVFDKLSGSISKVGAEGAVASGGLGKFRAQAAGLVSFAGKAAAAGLAVYTVGKAISNYLERNNSLTKVFDNAGAAQSAFFNALTRSNGALDDGVKSTVQYQLEQDKLVGKAAKAGITEDQLTTAISGTDKQFNALTDTWRKSGKPSGATQIAVRLLREEFKKQQEAAKGATAAQLGLSDAQAKAAKAAGLTAFQYVTANDALTKTKDQNQAAIDLKKLEIATNYQLMGTQDQLSKRYGITAGQVQAYASVLGITQDEVDTGKVTAAGYSKAVQLVADAYNTANAAGAGYLAQLQQFSTSGGTAEDRAKLIGATLRAANGDALGYAATLNNTAVAQKTFADSLKQAASEVGKNGESTKAFLASVINLKTGTIDFTKSAAQPLIQGLQGIQDAAEQAAAAVFQHERATAGGKRAADDAYSVYVSKTRGALVDEAKQLGLTGDQARRFADQYFGLANAKDIKKKIEAIGTDPVVNVLNRIGQQLSFLTGHPWNPKVSANTSSAETKIQGVKNHLNQIPINRDILINADTAAAEQHIRTLQGLLSNLNTNIESGASKAARSQLAKKPPGNAGGGGVPEGWSTVGEGNPNTWELLHKSGSKVDVISNRDARKLLPGGPGSVPMFAAGTPTAKQVQAANLQRANIRFKIDNSDFARLIRAITGSTTSLASATRSLLADVRTATLKGIGSASLVSTIARENTQLVRESTRRTSIANKLKVANSKLADVQKQYRDEATTVRNAVLGSFDITTAGQQSSGLSSPESILASLKYRVDQAAKFTANLKLLGKRGLSKTALQQLAEAGPDRAGTNAAALAGASAQQIRQFDKLYSQLGAQGTLAGAATAGSLYSAGVNAAKGLVAGLKSQESALDRQMKHLANVMIDQIKRSLKIHSPSQVGHELGAHFGQGIANGIAGHEPTVRSASRSLAAAAIPRASIPGVASSMVPVVYVTATLDGEAIDHRADVRIEQHSADEVRALLAGRV